MGRKVDGNHNYMAIPRYERPFTEADTYVAKDYSDNNGNAETWYSIEMIGETEIGNVVFDDITIDYSGVTFENGGIILGNIKSFVLTSGQVKASIYRG